MLELRQAHPRRQGDIGEATAIAWLTRAGYGVWVPLGHSPDADLIAERDDRLFRVQMKTSTVLRNGRYEVSLTTKGGNRSWSGRVKRSTWTVSTGRRNYGGERIRTSVGRANGFTAHLL
jgi:hypothetical protein